MINEDIISKINPMDWHKTRYLNYIPKHFTRVKLIDHGDRKKLFDWLDANTVGRVGIEKAKDINVDDLWILEEKFDIGFEDPTEATLYTIIFR